MPHLCFSSSSSSSFHSSLLAPLLLLIFLIPFLCSFANSVMLLPADDPTAQMDKRGAPPAVRNPYSWMAEGEPDKRSALRRPQNPHSWMAINEEPGEKWIRFRRLGASRTGISRNPYSWTNF